MNNELFFHCPVILVRGERKGVTTTTTITTTTNEGTRKIQFQQAFISQLSKHTFFHFFSMTSSVDSLIISSSRSTNKAFVPLPSFLWTNINIKEQKIPKLATPIPKYNPLL